MKKKMNKKNIIVTAIVVATVAVIVIIIALCAGCSKSTATPDEATMDMATVDQIATKATLNAKDQAIVDSGLTVDDDGNVVDKDGDKIEPSEDGKVKIKDADGKEIEIDTDSVKTANNNKARVEETNAAVERSYNDNSGGNSGGGNSYQPAKSDSGSSKNNGGGSSSKNNGGNSGGGSTSKDEHAGKKYYEAEYKTVHHGAETDDVWVVDQEAYSYEEPVYKDVDALICSGCGCRVDMMSEKEWIAHSDQHIDNGERGGYYSDVIRVQVGTETVNVPEKGHYETRVIKEAYDEQVLVRPAGWY